MARGPSGPAYHPRGPSFAFLLYLLLLWRAAHPRSCDLPLPHSWRTARAGPPSICLSCFICSCYMLYLLLLYGAACPRSERFVGGPALICLYACFRRFLLCVKSAPQVGERLVMLSRMVKHAVTSMPKTAKMRMRSAAS